VLEGDDEVTGGTATADRFALRTRSSAFVWERGTDDLDDAFESEPCPIAVNGTDGGEAIAFDGRRFRVPLGRRIARADRADRE
jgi:hypothetical protein